MTPSTSVENEKNALSNLYLEPAKLDYLSVKTQIVMAAILSSILVFLVYWQTLNIGFLHDDFLHLDYVARAVLKADVDDFLAALHSNWEGSDLMRSYRPLVSISLFLDFILYRTNAVGFHLTNLILTCACSLFVALIASELSGAFGNRMKAVTAIWAALLFAAYPLHVESVAWVTGRVDLLCTVFYLAALYYFLRFRLLDEPIYLWLTAGCFAFSLLSKEMAVTLPVVATVFALLIPARTDLTAANGKKRFVWRIFCRPSRLEWQALAMLWLTLAVFAVMRTLALGDAIGGFGNPGLSAVINTFANKAALLKIALPSNEEVMANSKSLIRIALIPYIAAAVLAAVRCLVTPALIRCFVAIALFGAIALLPTYQVWNVAPNLCGSRMFFLSSAALALWLAFAFIANEDWIDRNSARLFTALGTIFLVFTLVFYAFFARANLSPFIEAGRRMETFRDQVVQYSAASQFEPGKLLLLNLPLDYRGASMLTRQQNFRIMMSVPFMESNIADRVGTSDMDFFCDHSFHSADKLNGALLTPFGSNPKFWSDAAGEILPLRIPTGEAGFQCQFDDLRSGALSPSQARRSDGRRWHAFNSAIAQVEEIENGARLYPGDYGLTAKQYIEPVNPLSTALIKVKMKVLAIQPVEQIIHLIRLTWDQDQNVISKAKLANLVQTEENVFECPLINNKEWLLGGDVKRVGLSLLPASYYVTIESIEGIATGECLPELSKSTRIGWFQVKATKVRDASSILVMVTKPDTTFDTIVNGNVLRNYRNISLSPDARKVDSPDSSVTGKVQRWFHLQQVEGTLSLPQEVYNDGKSHEVVAIALDKNGRMVGLPSRVLKVK
ncbi:MAG: glycosyltransferase family 39 protein [Candidatus Melainabacteria bacterium]|nr:glycosyltransferase family 39 protein [Candidatus Melainabacteria bacterium]